MTRTISGHQDTDTDSVMNGQIKDREEEIMRENAECERSMSHNSHDLHDCLDHEFLIIVSLSAMLWQVNHRWRCCDKWQWQWRMCCYLDAARLSIFRSDMRLTLSPLPMLVSPPPLRTNIVLSSQSAASVITKAATYGKKYVICIILRDSLQKSGKNQIQTRLAHSVLASDKALLCYLMSGCLIFCYKYTFAHSFFANIWIWYIFDT